MLSCYRVCVLFVLSLISVPAFSLEWHKAYERGRDRIRAGDCSQGRALMAEALRGNPKADIRTPTYGTMSIEYFPQYYLAVCAVEAGSLSEAQRYLKDAEGSRIASSKLAKDYQTLKTRLDGLISKQGTAKPVETKPPVQQQPQQAVPKPTPPPEKKPEPVRAEPVVRDNTAAINAALREGRDALRNGRYEEARSAANRVIGMQPDNREGRNLLNDIAARQTGETQSREKQQKIREVQQAMKRGELDTAEQLAVSLRSEYPSDSNVIQLQEQIINQRNSAVQDLNAQQERKTIEREVLTAYYKGDYTQAIQLAKQNLARAPQSWRLHFFLGCSYAALSMLEESDTEARLRLAREYFRRARSLSSSVSLPPHISPKILDVYRSS